MNQTDQDILLLERVLEKYRFIRPVPPSVQESILSSRKKILVRVLRTVGAFSALYGAYLAVYFAAKKAGIGALFVKCFVALFTVTSLSYGGYRLAATRAAESPIGESGNRSPVSTDTPCRWIDRITLYNGRIIHGAIVSRGDVYEILSEGKIIRIPANQIKAVKPVTIHDEKSRRTGHPKGR
ncbi:MAG: hypothetical protein JW838_07735 [Spirochaetes bacterium]|nr:hypothetical protein [Spirochaetota bacterium]